MTFDPVVRALAAALATQGGSLELLSDDLARVEVHGRVVDIYLDNLRRRIQAGEPAESAVAAFIAVRSKPPEASLSL